LVRCQIIEYLMAYYAFKRDFYQYGQRHMDSKYYGG
jgi:hypothetical protein